MMAYRKDNFLTDVNSRKEFVQYKQKPRNNQIPGTMVSIEKYLTDEKTHNVDFIEHQMAAKHFLKLHSYQELINTIQNPSTPYMREAILWETGTGKTNGALGVAMHYINHFRKQQAQGYEVTSTVFIIGFNHEIFKKELLRHPEFGFISHKEIRVMEMLKDNTTTGHQHDKEKYQEFVANIKKRLTNRKRGGFFRFFGYREFLNKIFVFTSRKREKEMLSNLNEADILKALRDGAVGFNKQLLDSFQNSLLICDEIHNVYNSISKNNWGIAIQAVLNKQPTLRALFLSATPINNSPTEVIDLLNLLGASLNKAKLFNGEELKPGALDIIRKAAEGKFSYLRDLNMKYYPAREIIGEEIPGIEYLRFKRATISELHQKVYDKQYHGTFANEDQYLVDLILPHPTDDFKGVDQTRGIFRFRDAKSVYDNAPQEWKEMAGISVDGERVVGAFAKLGSLEVYSPKYASMIKDLIRGVRLGRGKAIIYTHIVQMSGAYFAQEVLLQNGFIDMQSLPGKETLCSYCGFEKKYHDESASLPVSHLSDDEFEKLSQIDRFYSDITLDADKRKMYLEIMKTRFERQHGYTPCRFVMIHSKIDKSTNYKSMDMFNSNGNTDGSRCMVLIGSQMIRESFDFKAVFNMMIMIPPDNISTLIQIFGRVVRKGSFALVPMHKRKVWIRIYTNTLKDGLSHEEKIYKRKIQSYLVVQQIERVIHEVAIDSFINYNLIFPDGKTTSVQLGALPYDPAVTIDLDKQSLSIDTFSAYFAKKEVDEIVYLIKRLFILTPAWDVDELWDAVQHPPAQWELAQNPEMYLRQNFDVALSKLVTTGDFNEPIFEVTGDEMFHRLLDSDNKIIVNEIGQRCLIVWQGSFLVLFPIDDDSTPLIDYESCYRPLAIDHDRSININLYMSTRSIMDEYPTKKLKFRRKYADMDIQLMHSAICDYGSEFHRVFLEECIAYIYDFWTGSRKRSEYSDFYFKMIYYYDMIGVVFWANSVTASVKERYRKFITNSINVSSSSDDEEFNRDIVKILKSTINNWCSTNNVISFTESVKQSIAMSKDPSIEKVPGNLLPVGHYMASVPRFYYDKHWEDISDYGKSLERKWKENNIIIGYDEKSASGSHIRFKIRKPQSQVKIYKDTRKIEKGSECSSKPRPYLLELCRQLKITLPKKINVTIICNAIRQQLLRNEIAERKKDSNVKWFYYYFEKRPQLGSDE